MSRETTSPKLVDKNGIPKRTSIVRIPGSKDYSMIMTKLMSWRNALQRAEDNQEICEAIIKIAQKLRQLGFEKASQQVRPKVGRRKKGLFPAPAAKAKTTVIKIVDETWEIAKQINDLAKEKILKKKIKQKQRKRIAMLKAKRLKREKKKMK
ncbi:MAG: hypothetical protein EAZ55_00520 [Cytophagales bacterium]|nr:MAG: hypothetical protein EAZ55_00520 [Cytophagales bacterium]